MQVRKLSAKTGEGMADFLEFLERLHPRSHPVAAVGT
jgi:hypothetical protein